jgi:hypothetical protein
MGGRRRAEVLEVGLGNVLMPMHASNFKRPCISSVFSTRRQVAFETSSDVMISDSVKDLVLYRDSSASTRAAVSTDGTK